MPSKTEMSRGRGAKACLRRNHPILGGWGYTENFQAATSETTGVERWEFVTPKDAVLFCFVFLGNRVKAWMQFVIN